jgi:hypothetical protein
VAAAVDTAVQVYHAAAQGPCVQSALAEALSGKLMPLVCRGTWARVTIDKFRHWALQLF